MSFLKNNYASNITNEEARNVDWTFLFSIFSLLVIGIVLLYSATIDPNHQEKTYVLKQGLFIFVGLVFLFANLMVDYRWTEYSAYYLYFFNFLALIGVRFFGVTRNGARLWYDFKVFSFQPSETMKLCVVLALAKYFHTKSFKKALTFKQLVVPALIILLPSAVTIIQPDMGTGFHMMMMGFFILLFLKIRMKLILGSMLALFLSFPILWNFGLHEYQKDRIRVVIDPMSDPKGSGYNAIQSMIGVGSGQFVGKGFMQGTQNQLGFTPEGYTDFIFSVLAEEWGFLGCALYLFLLLLLIFRCLKAAGEAREKFGAILAIGVACYFALQSLINVAMVIGIFPIVGIPLPLISYGGTSILSLLIALGLVLNVSYRRRLY